MQPRYWKMCIGMDKEIMMKGYCLPFANFTSCPSLDGRTVNAS